MATRPQSRFLPEPKTAVIIGCPFRGGQPKLGVDKAPDYFIEAGLPQQLTELGWAVKFDGHLRFEETDVQNDTPIGKLKNPRLVSSVCKTVAQAVGEHAKQGRLPVTLGGDHSLAMATISGTLEKYPDACVIYVDAHADINTPETTGSGNMHGMPLSFVLGIGPKVDEFAWLQPRLKPHRLVYIGLRDVDESERRILREHDIKAFSMHDIDKHGIGRIVEMALDHVNPGRTLPLHMSFDIDAFDPSVAPATGAPVRRGLTYGQGLYICEAVHETGCLVALDIMEVNPLVGDEQGVKETVAVGCAVARAALGETLL